MTELTKLDIDYLKSIFEMKWPDAARAIKNKRDPQHYHAACQWMGFKTGYSLGRAEN